jgi:4a-hydroxytetrahydrobiopterin dehydratase
MAPLTDQQITEKLESLSGWKRTDLEGKPGITKVFPTGSFLSGLGFVTRIAVLAEKANHHPDVVLTYPKVSIHLTTHSASGLTQKDFDLAAEIDQLK